MEEILEVAEDTYYEEVRLQGMIIGNINSNFEETLYYVKDLYLKSIIGQFVMDFVLV